MKCSLRFLYFVALLLLGANLCFARQQQPPQPDKVAEKPKEEKKPPVPEEKVGQTKHSVKIGGRETQETATAPARPPQPAQGAAHGTVLHHPDNQLDVSGARLRLLPPTLT